MVQLRIEGDSAAEVQAVADTIESLLPQHITFSEVKAGRNPRYAGRQKYFSYGQLKPSTDFSPDDPRSKD